jgi:hypothetical protein
MQTYLSRSKKKNFKRKENLINCGGIELLKLAFQHKWPTYKINKLKNIYNLKNMFEKKSGSLANEHNTWVAIMKNNGTYMHKK